MSARNVNRAHETSRMLLRSWAPKGRFSRIQGIHVLQHSDAVLSVDFSPDASLVLTASDDATCGCAPWGWQVAGASWTMSALSIMEKLFLAREN